MREGYASNKRRAAARTGKARIRVGFKGIVNSLDESVADMAYATKALNFAFEKGVLTGGIGMDVACGRINGTLDEIGYPYIPIGRRCLDIFLYRRLAEDGTPDDRIVVRLSDYKFIYTPVHRKQNWRTIAGLAISGEVSAVNYNYKGQDVLLLSSPQEGMYVINDEKALVCSDAPHFTSFTAHNERVYGSVKSSQNQLWFSDDFDPFNWRVSSDEAGYINFSDECGEVLKVVSFLNYLYIFREYGIFRLTAFGDQSEFFMKKLFTDTGRIYKSSIEVCGDKIIFYAEDGLYAFDGYEVARIAKELMPVLNANSISAAYLDDYYFMACGLYDEAEANNNAVVRYRLSDGTISVLYGVSVQCLLTVRAHNTAQVLALLNHDSVSSMNKGLNTRIIVEMSKSGKVLERTTSKVYVSPYSTMSSPALKTVRSASVLTKTPIKLTLKLDGERYEYKLSGSEQLQTVYVEKCGRRIGVEISCDAAEAYIAPVILQTDTISV